MTPHEESTIHKLDGPVPNMYIHLALFSVAVSRALHFNQSYAQCKVIHILKINSFLFLSINLFGGRTTSETKLSS